jgi:transglutaminase-like putative cysteine protease
MSAATLFSRLRATPRADALTPTQARWLGALLTAAMLPQALHLPIGIAVLGLALIALRLAVTWRPRARAFAFVIELPSWALAVFALAAAVAIRLWYGYFLGREPSVAFLFVLCGIKFMEARVRRDGTLVICLATFLLITPFLSSQSMFAAIVALPALLILGGALDVLERSPASATLEWRAPIKRTLTLMAQGLPIALLLFVMFPRLAGPLWGLPADRSAQTGLSDTMTPGMFTELALSDEVAFRVDFDRFPPPPVQRYWRGPVLSRFDGRVWSAAIPQLGSIQPSDGGRSIAYTVTLEASGQPWLFALDLPASLPRTDSESGESTPPSTFLGITRDQQLIARGPITQALRYSIVSNLRNTYPATSAFEGRANLRLPTGNPRSIEFAHDLRSRIPDDRAFIDAVLRFYREEPFVYTLAAPLLEREPIDQFLFETRRGFCEHYASSFVVLLRAAGIPARVVTGYQGGEINPNGGYMIVRQSDAHAWAEALIGGVWRRFDPTAAVAPSRVERGLASALPAGESVPLLARFDGGWIKNLDFAWDALNHGWQRHVVDFNQERQRTLWREWNLDLFSPWQIVGALVFVAGAWGGVVLLWLIIRRRRQERALVLWDDVCRRLSRAGLPRQPHEGPVAFVERAATRWPQFGIALKAIGEAYAMLRYGNLAADSRERAALVATLKHAIDALPSPARLRHATT